MSLEPALPRAVLVLVTLLLFFQAMKKMAQRILKYVLLKSFLIMELRNILQQICLTRQLPNWCLENGIPGCSGISAEEIIVLADDSGLEIDWLGGEPGIYSARYMGHETSYREKNANLISRLDGVPKEKRTARFVCAIAAALPDGNSLVTRGTIEGYIGWEECGSNGFGYDPIFYLYENDKSTAELSAEEKNAISHRGKALRQMKKMLEEQK